MFNLYQDKKIACNDLSLRAIINPYLNLRVLEVQSSNQSADHRSRKSSGFFMPIYDRVGGEYDTPYGEINPAVSLWQPLSHLVAFKLSLINYLEAIDMAKSKDKTLIDVNTALVYCLELMRRDLVVIGKSFNSLNSKTSRINNTYTPVLNNDLNNTGLNHTVSFANNDNCADNDSPADNEYLAKQNDALIKQNYQLNEQLTNLMQLISVHTTGLNQLNTFIDLVTCLLKVMPLASNSDNFSNASSSENPNSSNSSNNNLGCATTVCCSNTASSSLSSMEVKS